MPRRLTQDEFIARARKVWGDKFDLSSVRYEGQTKTIDVVCPEHGIFHPSAGNFLRGHGCPECGREIVDKARVKDTEYFIKKAKEIHGDKYDYSRVVYRNNRTKVEIICPVHGSFFQKPNDHTYGKGCPSCAGVQKSNTQDFVAKAEAVHHGKYDYSLVDYKGNKKKVAILCPDHGLFWQTPNSHLLGRGCPICQESYGEQSVRHYLDERGILYKQEYCFPDCKDRATLRFDFYLPDINTCIEFQGKQHYENEPFFDGYGGLAGRKRRDEIKRKYCKDKGIRLIEIKYTDDIIETLKQTL